VFGVQAPLAFVIGLTLFPLVTSDLIQISTGDRAFTTDSPSVDDRAPVNPPGDPGGVLPHPNGDGPQEATLVMAMPRAAGESVSTERPATVGDIKATGPDSGNAVQTEPAGSGRGSPTALPEAEREPSPRTTLGWWDHALLAFRLGGALAVLPIGYFLYVVADPSRGPSVDQFVPAAFVVPIAWEVAFWLTAACMFGCAYDYLRGENGLQKGAVLTAVYAGANLGAAVIGVTGDPLWMVRSFQLWLFLMVLGLWMEHDLRAISWKELFDELDVNRTSNIAKHFLPVATALAVVITQLIQHNTYNAITSLISGSDSIVCFLSILGSGTNC
jgi:hypothetical protein